MYGHPAHSVVDVARSVFVGTYTRVMTTRLSEHDPHMSPVTTWVGIKVTSYCASTESVL